ncbi:ATP-binding protein [Bythopirellula goksoeyrii]|uniref:histidine kinase n=1 Tax=Bythopirellula goksoeyrii TaxID=1400387 RepID=A0A5B9QBR4_9BACT|nr:ATP-binding protein [Bythopirellula goksoeyrii]QEG35015.1 Sensor protein ZraS [Bythopirellula goksoeyrii]
MPSLFVIRGRDQGTRFQLEDAVHTVGRTQANSIRLHDTEVSREHAELVRRGDVYVLRDLSSSNGTFINGQHATDRELVSGDQLQFGRSLLLYTGFVENSYEDIADKVDIIPRADSNDGSRIVAALSHSSGSDWLLPDASDSSSPWIARARSNLQIMYRTALAVSHTMDIDQLLARIMEMIFDWVDADRGCIMLYDTDADKLVPKVRRHRRGVRTDDKISISKTILDYVVEHTEGVLTSNARDDKRWDPTQSIVSLGVREAICVPMQGRYNVVGVIYIDTVITPQRMLLNAGKIDQFTEEHLRLMIAIAHQAALAVEDTSYYKAMLQAERLAAVGQTIASLSHHIKNILQGVRGGSYLIELGLADHEKLLAENTDVDAAADKAVETIRKGWGIVERNQERISALVMDMLTFSKEREPEPRVGDLNELVKDVVELMQVHAEETKVSLAAEYDEAMPLLLFDFEAMHRALLNVVTNAIDASEESDGPQVTVTTSFDPTEKTARLVVTDNGAGISPDDLDAIFHVFVSRKGGRGTGLGLPVSRKILEEHGGQILVDSTPGKGSSFTLELPANQPTKEQVADFEAELEGMDKLVSE